MLAAMLVNMLAMFVGPCMSLLTVCGVQPRWLVCALAGGWSLRRAASLVVDVCYMTVAVGVPGPGCAVGALVVGVVVARRGDT